MSISVKNPAIGKTLSILVATVIVSITVCNSDYYLSVLYDKKAWILADYWQYKQAIKDSNIAILLNPDYGSAYENRGYCHYKLSHYDKAVSDFSKAIKLGHKLNFSYYNRGVSNLEMGNYLSAVNDLTTSINRDQSFWQSFNYRGKARQGLKDFNGAESDFRRALKLNPSNLTVKSNLANLLLEVNVDKRAKKEMQSN